jgi:hypothetical protein
MNRFALLALLTMWAGRAGGQSPTVSTALNCAPATCKGTPPRTEGASGLPSNNAWVKAGAQLGYKIAGRGDFKDDFLVSARTELQTLNVGQPATVKIPLIGNLSGLSSDLSPDAIKDKTKELLNSAQGIHLSLQPYYAPTVTGRFKPTLYGTAGWKVNAAKQFTDTSKVVYLNQGRFSAGVAVEAFIVEDPTGKPEARPITFSLEPVYTVISGNDYRAAFGKEKPENLRSLELTAVIPIAGFGLLAQTIMSKGVGPISRIGILYVKGSSSEPAVAPREQPPARPAPSPASPFNTSGAQPRRSGG